MKDLKPLFTFIDKNKDQMIDLQTDLSAIEAMSPDNNGHGEWEKSLKLLEWVKKLGFTSIEEYHAPDKRVPQAKRPNLVVSLQGQVSRQLWIMTHMDVVPPGNLSLWKSDPFKVEVRGGKLVGRGVEDNQQGLVASLFALSSYLSQNVKPYFTVKLLFVADEETGSDYGIKYLLKKHLSLFKPDDLILVPDGGNPEGTMIEIAEKSILWLKFRVLGKQCHASMPQKGINAFEAGSHLVVALSDLRREFSGENALFDPPVSTFEPTKKEANVPNVNTLPGEDVFYLDCRILPEIEVEKVLASINMKIKEIEKQWGVKISYEILHRESSPPTPANSDLVNLVKAGVKHVYKNDARPMGIGGGTVAAHLREKKYDTVVWSTIEENAHMPNESARISNMVNDAKVMAFLMAGGES
ncbi:MAG: M20 family metallo-hydrolase [Spirochaetales bacterium]|nr:M20 family metallo-hydrolase [Spirochaetales bacterium]